MKHDCYKCTFRGTVPGSAHSSCNALSEIAEGSDLEMLKTGYAMGMISLQDDEGNKAVELDQHGIDNGWAMWPIDFDPIWVNKCQFFNSTEKNEEGS